MKVSVKSRRNKTRRNVDPVPAAKQKEGRPRMGLELTEYGFHGLLWPRFKQWLTQERRGGPRGLASRLELWNAIRDQARYFRLLSVLAVAKPELAAPATLAEAFNISPDLTLEAVLFLRAWGRDLKDRGVQNTAVFGLRGKAHRYVLSASERDTRRKMRRGHADFVAAMDTRATRR